MICLRLNRTISKTQGYKHTKGKEPSLFRLIFHFIGYFLQIILLLLVPVTLKLCLRFIVLNSTGYKKS